MTHALLLSIILTASRPYAHDFSYLSPSFKDTLYGIVMTESSGCINVLPPPHMTYSGCAQMLVGTANMFARCKCITQRDLERRPHIAIVLAARFLHYCAVRFHRSWTLAVSCYRNGEPVTAKSGDYPPYLYAVWEKLP